MKKQNYYKNKKCIDCGNLISDNATRCISCLKIYFSNTSKGNKNPNYKYDLDKNFLYQKYEIEKLTLKEISKIVSCCEDTIRRNLKIHNIKVRNSNDTRKNKPLSKEHRQKISNGLIQSVLFNPERHKKHICKELGCNNIIKYNTWKYSQGICRQCANKKHSIWMTGRFKGKNSFAFGKVPSHGKREIYKNILMRSSWEVNFAQWCDLSGIKWEYESKTFDLGDTTYTPDFYLSEFDLWIEVKGYWRDDAKKKYSLFKRKYPQSKIKLLMEKELKHMGIL